MTERLSAERRGEIPPPDRICQGGRLGKAAKDWPQLKFSICHAGYRYTGDDNPALAARQFDDTGRMDWVSCPPDTV